MTARGEHVDVGDRTKYLLMAHLRNHFVDRMWVQLGATRLRSNSGTTWFRIHIQLARRIRVRLRRASSRELHDVQKEFL